MNKYILIILSIAFIACGINDYNEAIPRQAPGSSMEWIDLDYRDNNGDCKSITSCADGVHCFGLQYTPSVSGEVTSYTTGFYITCIDGHNAVLSMSSCMMEDNSNSIDGCDMFGVTLNNLSGNSGSFEVTAGQPYVLHQICLYIPVGETVIISEDIITDLTVSIDTQSGPVTDFPEYSETELQGNCIEETLIADGGS